MEYADLLLTTAKISISFAGFASLVTLIGQLDTKDKLPLDLARLRGMILACLSALAFSLFPFLPHMFGASLAMVWRISSAAFFITGIALSVLQLYYVKRIGARRFGSLWITLPLLLLILILSASNAVLDLGQFSPGIYVFGLFTLLFISGVLFFLTFLSCLRGHTL